MKAENSSQLEGTHHQVIAPTLVLALLLNPFSYAAVAQQAPSQDASKSSGVNAQQAKVANPQSADNAAVPDNDNAPVPEMPPLNPAESASPSNDLLPDSPGAIESAQLETQQSPAAQSSAQSQHSEPAAQQPPSAMPKEPLGAAAAETIPTMGIAASRPAGAALASGKQRRVRTILIRMGAVVGAAAAVGVTMALTEASPSKPPGAH